MSTVKIDPSTGLPELPEGQFWRVTYEGWYNGEPGYRTDRRRSEYQLYIMESYKVRRHGVAGWFGASEDRPVVVASVPVYLKLDSIYPSRREAVESGTSIFGANTVTEKNFEIERDSQGDYLISSNIPSKFTLQTLAIRLIEARLKADASNDAYRKREAKIKAFLGDYPPKNLDSGSKSL